MARGARGSARMDQRELSRRDHDQPMVDLDSTSRSSPPRARGARTSLLLATASLILACTGCDRQLFALAFPPPITAGPDRTVRVSTNWVPNNSVELQDVSLKSDGLDAQLASVMSQVIEKSLEEGGNFALVDRIAVVYGFETFGARDNHHSVTITTQVHARVFPAPPRAP